MGDKTEQEIKVQRVAAYWFLGMDKCKTGRTERASHRWYSPDLTPSDCGESVCEKVKVGERFGQLSVQVSPDPITEELAGPGSQQLRKESTGGSQSIPPAFAVTCTSPL